MALGYWCLLSYALKSQGWQTSIQKSSFSTKRLKFLFFSFSWWNICKGFSWTEVQGPNPIITNQRTHIHPRSIMNCAVVMMFFLPVCKKVTARCKSFHALKIPIQGGKSNCGNTFTVSELYFHNAFVHIYLRKLSLTPFESKAFTHSEQDSKHSIKL